jgi:hypothetical protein
MSTIKFAAEPNAMVHEFLTDAATLSEEKDDLYARMNANREILRNLLISGKASKEQAEAIEAFYKPRAKNTKSDDAPVKDTPKGK